MKLHIFLEAFKFPSKESIRDRFLKKLSNIQIEDFIISTEHELLPTHAIKSLIKRKIKENIKPTSAIAKMDKLKIVSDVEIIDRFDNNVFYYITFDIDIDVQDDRIYISITSYGNKKVQLVTTRPGIIFGSDLNDKLTNLKKDLADAYSSKFYKD